MVETVVFTEPGVSKGPSKSNAGQEYHSFMKSQISKSKKQEKLLESRIRQTDKENDVKDAELAQLISDTRLIETYNVSQMTGRDRRKHFETKCASLGVKTKPNAPLPISIGMHVAAKSRSVKRIQEAKDTGLFTKSTKSRIQSEEGTKPKASKSSSGKGLFGSIGTIKDGIMRISEKQIKQVEKMSSKSSKKTINNPFKVTKKTSSKPVKSKGKSKSKGKGKKRR